MADATYTNIVGFAPEIAPYAQTLLGKTQALTDSPYQTYNQERIAQFNPLQQQSFMGAGQLGPSGASLDAASGLFDYSNRAASTGYNPSNYGNQFSPQNFGYDAQTAQNTNLSNAPMVSAGQYNTPMMNTAQTGYNPGLQNFQMGPAERVNTQSFAQPGAADAYMSPYMQSVVDIQKREAQRQSGIQGTQQQAQAAQAGAFGGGRDAIMRAERERNLSQQMGDIQAQGSQAAYQQAQQQFNAEQQARLAAQQANQAAGLTTGGQNLSAALGVQQLGAQTGLQTSLANLSAEQQANVQNQAAQLQTQGMNAQQAMQAALANQQTQSQYGLQQGQFNQQTALANQAAQNQARQFGAGQNLQAAGMGAQYGQAANQLNEQSRQYGAGLGLQGLQAGMQGMSNLGAVGQNIYGQQANALGIQNAFGGQQQQQTQNVMNQQYQDFLNQENAPYKQLNFMSDIIRGTPTTALGSSMYQSPPSLLNQVAGLGTVAAGLFGAYNQANKPAGSAKGGAIKSKKPQGGLPALLLNSMA